MNLKNIWLNIFGETQQSLELWMQIEKAYTGEGRYFHNLTHLEMMFKNLKEIFPEFQHNKSLLLAIFMHDFVYSFTSYKNEIKSARKARKFGQKLELTNEEIELACQLILATKNHKKKYEEKIFQVMLDLDLSIFATNFEDYISYAYAIRQEYNKIPDVAYNLGRKKFLRSFLEEEKVYQTKEFEELNTEAKNNILWEMDCTNINKLSTEIDQIPVQLEGNTLSRVLKVQDKFDYEVHIDLGSIDYIMAFKEDNIVYDTIVLAIHYNGTERMLITESCKNFSDVCVELGQRLEGCLAFEEWYFDVMFPAFELCLTSIYKRDDQVVRE